MERAELIENLYRGYLVAVKWTGLVSKRFVCKATAVFPRYVLFAQLPLNTITSNAGNLWLGEQNRRWLDIFTGNFDQGNRQGYSIV